MIDGLKLTMSGVELQAKLTERIEAHARYAAQCAAEPPAAGPGRQPPDEAAAREIEYAHAQIETLTLIREYVIADEVYRLGEFDLRFADLLPEPEWMDYEGPPRATDATQPALPGWAFSPRPSADH